MSLQIFDFRSNCTATSELYNGLHNNGTNLVALLQSLSYPNENFTDALFSTQLQNQSFVREIISVAAQNCHTEVCTSLDFTGNADIAGIGSISAYGIITGMAATSIILRTLKVMKDKMFEEIFDNDESIAYRKLTENFFINLVYLLIVTQVAFWAYLSKMKTFYELIISQLVTRLIGCACSATALAAAERLRSDVLVLWPIGFIGSVVSGIFSFFAEKYSVEHTFIDSQCLGAYSNALLVVKISTAAYIGCVVFVFIFGFLLFQDKIFGDQDQLSDTMKRLDNFAAILALTWLAVELVLLICFFILVVVVRTRAKSMFGSGYADDALGYGQIMSVGFCLETFVSGTKLTMRALKKRIQKKQADRNGQSSDQRAILGSEVYLEPESHSGATQPHDSDVNSLISLSPSRSRTSNMEGGLSPKPSFTSISLPSGPANESSTSTSRGLEPDPASMTLQKRPTFS